VSSLSATFLGLYSVRYEHLSKYPTSSIVVSSLVWLGLFYYSFAGSLSVIVADDLVEDF
jgi:hypothetical protein